MIKGNKCLTIIRDQVVPDEAQATEIVLEAETLQHDALLHIGTCTDYVLTLGRRSFLKNFYNLDKLKADGIYVHHRPYGGSGTIYGPRDVLFSLYVNKASFLDGHKVDAAHAHRFFNWSLTATLNELGLAAYLDEQDTRREEDGVCAHLQGRSEIRAPNGNRMVASVYREDDLGFYMRGMMIVTLDWAKIYEYLDSPTEPLYPLDCIEMQLERTGITEELIDLLIAQFARSFSVEKTATITDRQREVIAGIKDRYRVI